jgi:hypothetical protein
MEKELWLDQQEIEQLLSGTLFWQDVQNRANIKIVHKPKEENSPARDKQDQNKAFLMEQTFSNMTVSENKPGAEISDDISKDLPEDEGIEAIQEVAASVSAVEKQVSESIEATETMAAEAENNAGRDTAPELAEKAAFEVATEEFSEVLILEEIIEEADLEKEITEKEIVAQKETYREERIIFADSKGKKEYFKETSVRETSEAKRADLHNTTSFSWDSEELQVETIVRADHR